MLIRYRGIARPQNECVVTRNAQNKIDQIGRIVESIWNYKIDGTIIGTGADADAIHADVTAQRIALENMFSVNGGLFQLVDNDGTVLYQIIPQQTINGPTVKVYANPNGGAAQYVNSLSYTIELEARFPSALLLLSFEETLEITGNGGPKFTIRTPKNGDCIKQKLSKASPVTASQSGRATGRQYPSPPKPLWRDSLVPESEGASKFYDNQGVYGISWNYRYWSVGPLSGVPNLP